MALIGGEMELQERDLEMDWAGVLGVVVVIAG